MKVTFDFDIPDDEQAYKMCANAQNMCSFMWDFEQYLRTQEKYAEVPDTIDVIREKFYELRGENNVSTDIFY